MTEHPDFGVLLGWLADRRNLDQSELSLRAAIHESELQAILGGGVPSSWILGRLASALDLHVADLFAIAQVELPRELAPVDPAAGRGVPRLVDIALCLWSERQLLLREYAQSLPQFDHNESRGTGRVYEQYPAGFGAVLMHMLSNRNLDWSSSVKVLSRLTGLHLAASTIGMIGRGEKEIDAAILRAFAIALGVRVGDLFALSGGRMVQSDSELTPDWAGVAGLIWDVRRLSVDQIRQVRERAESMQNFPGN